MKHQRFSCTSQYGARTFSQYSLPTPTVGITNILLTSHFPGLKLRSPSPPLNRLPEAHSLPYEEQPPGHVAPADNSLFPFPASDSSLLSLNLLSPLHKQCLPDAALYMSPASYLLIMTRDASGAAKPHPYPQILSPLVKNRFITKTKMCRDLSA